MYVWLYVIGLCVGLACGGIALIIGDVTGLICAGLIGTATVGPESAGLLYYVTHAYDAAHPDEHRRPWDSVEGIPWSTRHG